MGRSERNTSKPVTLSNLNKSQAPSGAGSRPKPSQASTPRGANNQRVSTIHDFKSSSGNSSSGLPVPSGYASMDDPARVPPLYEQSDNLLTRIFPYSKLFSIVTALLISNTIMFIITLIVGGTMYDGAMVSSNKMGGPSSETLIGMGGKWWPDIYRGEVWRLITPIFLHSGLLHIMSNMFFLARFGWVLERRWGWWRFFIIYMLSGLGGTLLSCIGAKNTVSVGASGALFGVLVADITFIIYNYRAATMYGMEIGLLSIILILNIIFGFLSSGVDNFGHLGGMLMGVFLGGCIPFTYYKWKNEKYIRSGFAVLASIAMITLIACTATLSK